MLLTKFGKHPIKHVEEESIIVRKKERTRHACVISMTRTLPAYVVTPGDSVVR